MRNGTGTHTCPRCHGTGQVPDRRTNLTPDHIRTIHYLYEEGELQKNLAARFGVTPGAISRILRGSRR